jgi:DNA polymerase-3 subunit delta
MSALSYKQFIKSLKKSKNQIFLFNGNEGFLKGEGTDLLLKKYAGMYDEDFDLVLLNGKEVKDTQIIGELNAAPMMNDYRIIIIRDVNKCTVKVKNIIKKWLDDPSDSIIGIFSTSEQVSPKKVKFIEKFSDKAVIVNCYEIEYKDMVQRIKDGFAERKREVDEHIIDFMIDMIGFDLSKMKNEIKKVLIYANDKPIITLDDVSRVVSNIRSDSIFSLVDLIVSKEIQKALKMVSNVIKDRSDQGILLVSLLCRQLKNILIYDNLRRTGLEDSIIAQRIGINPYFLRNIGSQSGKLGTTNVVAAFKKLLLMDIKLKSSPLSCNAIIENFVVDFCNN